LAFSKAAGMTLRTWPGKNRSINLLEQPQCEQKAMLQQEREVLGIYFAVAAVDARLEIASIDDS